MDNTETYATYIEQAEFIAFCRLHNTCDKCQVYRAFNRANGFTFRREHCPFFWMSGKVKHNFYYQSSW